MQIQGTSDQITIIDGLWAAINNPGIARDRVEYFDLADGTRIAFTDVQLALLTGTSGSDSIVGYTTNDTLTGGGQQSQPARCCSPVCTDSD